ncbi:MAG: hypothetical protein OXC11_15420 [Rhodospirillales bacterium]|nr:hypothetical protein [Rhodospirillales bacterium]
MLWLGLIVGAVVGFVLGRSQDGAKHADSAGGLDLDDPRKSSNGGGGWFSDSGDGNGGGDDDGNGE